MSSTRPKNEIWPDSRSLRACSARSRALSRVTSSWLRSPNASQAPLRTRLSRARALTSWTPAPRVALLDDLLDRTAADVLDRRQAEADATLHDGEVDAGLVYVRGKDFQPALFGVHYRRRYFVRVALHVGEQGGHVLDRVVGLQIRGLV